MRISRREMPKAGFAQLASVNAPGRAGRSGFLTLLAAAILGVLLSACGVTPEPVTSVEEDQELQLPRGWGPATQLAGGVAGTAGTPQVAVSANGSAMAVWQQGNSIYANRFSRPPFTIGNRCCWGAATAIETSGRAAQDPHVSMDGNGNAIAVWRQHDGSAYSIYANRFTPAGGWGTPRRIEASGRDAHSPQVAMDDLGNAIAVWIQHDGTAYSVYQNRFNQLIGDWSSSPTVIETSNFSASAPRVAMSSFGNAVVVWRQGKVHYYTPPSIYASVLTVGEGWSSPSKLDVDSWDWWIGGQDVAMDEDGNAIAVWHQSNQKRDFLYARRLTPTGGWNAPYLVGSATHLDASQVAVGPDGEAMAVWRTMTNSGVYAGRFTPTAGWAFTGSPSTVITSIRNPQVGVDRSGNAVVLWESYTGTGYDLYANGYSRTYAPGYLWGKWQWGTPRSIESSSDSVSHARVAVASGGDAVAVWAQSGGIYASIYGY